MNSGMMSSKTESMDPLKFQKSSHKRPLIEYSNSMSKYDSSITCFVTSEIDCDNMSTIYSLLCNNFAYIDRNELSHNASNHNFFFNKIFEMKNQCFLQTKNSKRLSVFAQSAHN